jgi:hypothetical protein
MGIKSGKGLSGALGSMRDMNYQYVPLPYKEMMAGNLMRQQSYDEAEDSIDTISDLYNEQVMDQDRESLQKKEDTFNSELDAEMQSVGGDLGKLAGFLRNQYRGVTRDKTYGRSVQSKTAYDAYYKDLMEADIDPEMKAYKLKHSKANYLGAEKEVFRGTSYVDMNQTDLDTAMRKVAKGLPDEKTKEQVPVLINTDTGLEFEVDKDGKYIGATKDNSKWEHQAYSRTFKDPTKIANALNGAIANNSTYASYIQDLFRAQNNGKDPSAEDLNSFVQDMSTRYAEEYMKNDSSFGKIGNTSRSGGKGKKGDNDFVKFTVPGATTSIENQHFLVGRDQDGNAMKIKPLDKLYQLRTNPDYSNPSQYTSEMSIWNLAVANAEEKLGRDITDEELEGLVATDGSQDIDYKKEYEAKYGAGSYDGLSYTDKNTFEYNTMMSAGLLKNNSRIEMNSILENSLNEVLSDATMNLGFELRSTSTTSGEVKDIMSSLNIVANTNFDATGLDLHIVDSKGDDEGYRTPNDEEVKGNFHSVDINGLTPRPVYDPESGKTNFKVQGTFKVGAGKDAVSHSFEAWLDPNTPMLQQVWASAGMPEPTPTLLELGKLMVKNQIVVPKALEAFGANLSTPANIGVMAMPNGSYALVELGDGTVDPKYKNGKLVVIKSESGNNIIYPSLNAMSNYIDELTSEQQ